MIHPFQFKNLQSGDKLILTNFTDRGFMHKYFDIGDSFSIKSSDDPDRIDLIRIEDGKSYWFTEEWICECFDTAQSLRNEKIETLLK
jgi:hypothetical protein